MYIIQSHAVITALIAENKALRTELAEAKAVNEAYEKFATSLFAAKDKRIAGLEGALRAVVKANRDMDMRLTANQTNAHVLATTAPGR